MKMNDIDPYQGRAGEYDEWYDQHRPVYEAELTAVRSLVPHFGIGLEIGVGTARFGAPLKINYGLEPSAAMRAVARLRGVRIVAGTAEAIPFLDRSFDLILMVTAMELLRDPHAALEECRRILRPNGQILIGFIDPDRPIGREFARTNPSRRPTALRFFTPPEMQLLLAETGFKGFDLCQTLFGTLEQVSSGEPIRKGFGQGSFVVVRAVKKR